VISDAREHGIPNTTGIIDGSELKVTIAIDRRENTIKAVVDVRVDGNDGQSPYAERVMNKYFKEVFATVNNKIVDVIEDETGRLRPLIVEILPPTPKLEVLYRKIGLDIADAYGAQFEIDEVSDSFRPTFRFKFSSDYIFPDQY